MSDMELEGDKIGCFQTASRKLTKRKHSEMNSSGVTATETQDPKRSFFSTIGEKFGFHRTSETVTKPILVAQDNQQVSTGEHNNSFVNDNHQVQSTFNQSYSYCSINLVEETENEQIHPKKRVKFDEENLICSSITYQRKSALRRPPPYRNPPQYRLPQPVQVKNDSIFTKFLNFTANLF